MSGRTKKIIYNIISVILLLCACAGTVLLACFVATGAKERAAYTGGMLLCFVVFMMILPLPTVLHECGHALGGLLCGMRVIAVSFGIYCLDWRNRFSVSVRIRRGVNGATGLLPKREKGARGKLVFALYAGAALDFIYAAVIFALYFAVTGHPAMQFFALFAPFCIYEGVMALYPAELPAGPTDGKFALGLIGHGADAEVALRVMTAQGLLYRNSYAELPSSLLYGAPVVREDSAAFLAMLQLQWRALACKRDAEAVKPLSRLGALFDELPAESRGEVAADLICGGFLFPEAADMRAKYAEELRGASAEELVAACLLERTEENEQRARKAVAGIKMAGEREYLGMCLELPEK